MVEPDIDLGSFRASLLQHRDALLQVAASGGEAARTVELDQSRVGRLSRMDALQTQAMSVEGNRRRDVELRRIEAALRRLDAGDYGYCLDCGEPIARRRLEVDPAASRCIQCASLAETDGHDAPA